MKKARITIDVLLADKVNIKENDTITLDNEYLFDDIQDALSVQLLESDLCSKDGEESPLVINGSVEIRLVDWWD